MESITKATVTEDVALITLRNIPADMKFISHVFNEIAGKGINVDMISQTAPLGEKINLSFTVSGDNLGDVLELFSGLRKENPKIKTDISGGNCKISLYGESMRDIPGVAAKAFDVISGLNLDVRIITTSEIDISILVPESDFSVVKESFEDILGIKIS